MRNQYGWRAGRKPLRRKDPPHFKWVDLNAKDQLPIAEVFLWAGITPDFTDKAAKLLIVEFNAEVEGVWRALAKFNTFLMVDECGSPIIQTMRACGSLKFPARSWEEVERQIVLKGRGVNQPKVPFRDRDRAIEHRLEHTFDQMLEGRYRPAWEDDDDLP